MRIVAWGAHAQRFATRHAGARLAGLFSRSLHLEADGDFLCIGCESIGRGPLNAVMDPADWSSIDMGSALGTAALLHRDTIHIGRNTIHTGHAAPWRPSAWPRDYSCDQLALAVQRCMAMAGNQAPSDGLARLALGLCGPDASALARVARPRLRRLQAWLAGQTAEPPVDLLGLGPGLTPSGDDVLVGVLLALHATRQWTHARAITRAIAKAAPLATTELSGACLRAAAEGLGCEILHATIGALLVDDANALTRTLTALGAIGHTSGWDAFAGAVCVLQASAMSPR
jgi:Protein of unknown function (DUF2877)